MANFYRDNEDIQFLFRHINLGKLAEIMEEGFRFAREFDYAPADTEEAVRNYDMVLDSVFEWVGVVDKVFEWVGVVLKVLDSVFDLVGVGYFIGDSCYMSNIERFGHLSDV